MWAAARSEDATVYSLDERFPEDGVTVLRAAASVSPSMFAGARGAEDARPLALEQTLLVQAR